MQLWECLAPRISAPQPPLAPLEPEGFIKGRCCWKLGKQRASMTPTTVSRTRSCSHRKGVPGTPMPMAFPLMNPMFLPTTSKVAAVGHNMWYR